MRDRWLGGLMVALVMALAGVPALASAAPATPVVWGISAICDPDQARTVDELVALATAGVVEHGAAWYAAALAAGTPGPVAMVRLEAVWVGTPVLPAGAPADAATTRAVTAALATYIACENDGNLAAVAVFWPDAHLREVLGTFAYARARALARGMAVVPATVDPAETREMVLGFLAGGAPRDPAARQTLQAVTEVQDRGNGLVTATMLLATGDAAPTAYGVILEQRGHGWQLQDLPYPLDPPAP